MKKQTYIFENKPKGVNSTPEMVKLLVPEEKDNALPTFTPKKLLASDASGVVEATVINPEDVITGSGVASFISVFNAENNIVSSGKKVSDIGELIKVGNGWILASEYANGFHAPLGVNAIDLGTQESYNIPKKGAIGISSINMGVNCEIAEKGVGAITFGYFNKAIGRYSLVFGASNESTAIFQIKGGEYSVTSTGEHDTSKNGLDVLFALGNGINNNNRNNAITLLRNGLLTIDATRAMIEASTNPKTVVTKEWVADKLPIADTQILVSTSQNVQPGWNKKTIIFDTNCTITVPATLVEQYEFNFIIKKGITVTWAKTDPFVWYLENPPTAMTGSTFQTKGYFLRELATNNIHLEF